MLAWISWAKSQEQSSVVKWKQKKYSQGSPLLPSVDGGCFFARWFLVSVSCAASPWPCVALCRCPGRCPSTEHFTVSMVHVSLPAGQHVCSGHHNFPLEERGTIREWALCTLQREHLTAASFSCNSLRAGVNWVWMSMKDTENGYLNVCIWKDLHGAGSWRDAMLVFVEYNASPRFCIVSLQRSISA